MDLASRRTWLLLGHYRDSGDGPVSEADNLNFFLAENGKTDPRAELEATIRAFFVPPDSLPAKDEQEQKINENYHPRCNFPARFEYLRRNLKFDPAIFPRVDCARFTKMHNMVRAKSASLIFASYYAADPASTFGHTLLRLDPVDPDTKPIAVNFSANTTGYDMARYVIYGLFGGFKGYFSYIPYEHKILEYSFSQNRDIWEYELDLTPEDIEFIQLHIWELKTTGFDYFYMTENCSYRLLTLIEIARPDLHLQEHFPAWVVPGETIRVINDVPGLIRRKRYIPSFRNRIDRLASDLSDEERELFEEEMEKDYTEEKEGPMDPGLSPELQTLVKYVRIYRNRKELLQPPTKDGDQPVPEEVLEGLSDYLGNQEPVPERISPVEEGHELPAMGAGIGMMGISPFVEYRIRPVMHGFENNAQGYSPHSALSYVDARLRYYPEDDLVVAHQVDVVKIISLGGGDFLGSRPGFFFNLYEKSIYERGDRIRNQDRQYLTYSLYQRWGDSAALVPDLTDMDDRGVYKWIQYANLLDDYDYYNTGSPDITTLFLKGRRDDYIDKLDTRREHLNAYPLMRIDFMPSLSLFAGRPGGTELIVTGYGGARIQGDSYDPDGNGLFPAAGLQILLRTDDIRVLARASATASSKRPDPEASLTVSWSLDRNFEFMFETATDGYENEASIHFFAHY